ncbi:stage III sporulation protein AE [Eubacteriales bacterium OttesenSCG-928-K08]|nr:stage III sporulation protein AE [Eubacteriales bacterium OttesenSCG-928-K08]
MNKKLGLLIAFIAGLLLFTSHALARADVPQEIQDGVDGILNQQQFDEWERLFGTLPEDVRNIWGDVNMRALVSDYALGAGEYAGASLFEGVWSLFRDALPDLIPMLLGLLSVAIISGLLRAMADAGMQGIGDVAGFVCQCFGIGIAMTTFLSLAVLARDCIEQTAGFIEVAFPVLLTLLTAAGGIASAGIFQPAMVMLSSGVAVALQTVVLPIVLAGGVLGVLNNLTDRVQLSQLFQLSKTAAKWVIGLLFTLYFGVTTLQGLTAASLDGISIRTAKYAMDKLIPIVGGVVSGTVDTVLGCAVLVKNAVGVTAIVVAFSIVLVPLLRIAAGMLAFRLAAALCEPIGEPRLPKMLASLAEVLTYLFAAATALSVMFIITVGLLIGTGNAAIVGG